MVLVSLVVLFTPGSDVPSVAVSDKLVHGLLFAALAASGVLAGLPLTGLALGLVAYAGGSEVLQAVLPIHRDGDLADALTDVVGAAVGLAVGVLAAEVLAQKR